MTHAGRHHHVRLGEQWWWQAEAVGHVRGRRVMEGLASATRELPCTHVPVVDVRLQVTLGQVSTLAALHHAAHVQRATLALFNPLHWVCAAVDDQTETTKVGSQEE